VAEKNGEDKKNDDNKSKSKDLGPAISPVNFPLGAFGREKPPEQPATVVFRGATVWTCGPQGNLEQADVVVESGKIKSVGTKLPVPEGALIIDVTGKHLSPGIIDCHSHIATDGGVNESGQTITAEVRIGDFVDPNDIAIYWQLAGGVTASNILHGSANTIGGQNQVLKFRWGANSEEMKFAAAPQGIKFALGENVKQSNWPRNTGRYPQTRMGVEQLVRDGFQAARRYRQQWDIWNRTKVGLPPRIDLELEALAEVVEGKRLIHCHSYRGDEILALIRTCDDFGIKIATFQHVLEGYKVADAIAKHGAGGSTFSDWWAYKFEVYDAIPYNGALLHNAGVVVSFNSDNAELARRLNLEAAKALRYGNVPPEEALKFVTLNPAKQLGIDEHVGSLEPGKDADLVVWSGSPLSNLTRCEQTWVDGRRYFDLTDDAQLRQQAAELKARLVQRVLASGEPAAAPGEDAEVRWPREDLFCGHHDHGDHHHDHQGEK
jgi:N-acetylglucosamine-6-phosphate deacetylase